MIKIFGVGEKSGDDKEMMELSEDILQNDINEENLGQIALDILETPDSLIIIAPIGGIRLDDIDVSLNTNILTLRGKREKPFFYNGTFVTVRNSECFWGEFVRNVILPENLDFENISAQMENNLLVIRIEKLRFSSQHIKIDRVES